MGDIVIITVPIRVVSEANRSRHEHWAVTSNRVTEQRNAVAMALLAAPFECPSLPLLVTLTRLAPRELDRADNLPRSCKAIVDEIAHQLGIDDKDPRMTIHYQQRRGKPREYAVEIHFAARGTCATCGQAVAV